MKWILFTLYLIGNGDVTVVNGGKYNSMAECFDERDKVVELIGRPIFNYQVICVAHTRE